MIWVYVVFLVHIWLYFTEIKEWLLYQCPCMNYSSLNYPPPISTWQIPSAILFEECVLPLRRPKTTSVIIIYRVKTSIVIFIGYMCTILVKRSNGSTPKHEKIVKIHIFPPIATMGLHKHDPIMFHGHVFHEALSWTPTAILHAFGSIYYKI